MKDVTPSSQFIANDLKVYNIHFQKFFMLFTFCCPFRQIVTYSINERSHPFSCIAKNSMFNDNSCQ